MRTLMGSTALALVVGFGLAAASGPAAAQDQDVFANPTVCDADGDGNLTSDEWRAWHEEQFASRSEASGGEMSMEDFGAWYSNPEFGVSTDPND